MKRLKKEIIFYLIPLPLIFLSLFIGPSEQVGPIEILDWVLRKTTLLSFPGPTYDSMVETIVLHVRLPRVLLTFFAGAALTASGTSLQALFRNPLVSPDILGISSGAAFGAALALTSTWLPLQLTAFVFGLIAVGLSYFIAQRKGDVSLTSLILSGIIVNGIFTSLLTIVQFLTDPFKLQTIVHWTMGNLHHANWSKWESAFFPILLGGVWLYGMRWRMNVLSLGDEETRAVGLDPKREKIRILIPATLIASASVAVAGVIGMVGLAVPHIVRMMVGPDNTRTMPVSFAFGGIFLLLVDNFSRTVASFEVPIGIFTTLIGGSFFVYLLKRAQDLYQLER
ncbi:MAG TPA: iron ABC transporter permease [Thermodesulfobacteriota bacterium]|nr:iron ABC transporter permease [Thermodesulfobacteriota bacterium]